MTTRLQNVVVKEVSLVPKGANNKRIFLRKDSGMEDNTVALEKAVAEAAAATVALEKAAAEQKALTERLEALEKAALDAAAATAAEKVALEKAAADANAKAVELEKALATEKEAKEVAESIQKAADTFKNLPEKAEVLGPLLRTVRKADAAAADAIEALLKKVDAISKGALDTAGSAKGEDAPKSAWEEIEKRAKALVIEKKATTFAAAVDQVMVADKALYNQYQSEKR